MPERTTVRLPEELLGRARRKAAVEGRTLTSLIEEGLRTVIADKRETSGAGPPAPRVSTAKGGLVPGVDLGKLDADDIEYVRRMQRRP